MYVPYTNKKKTKSEYVVISAFLCTYMRVCVYPPHVSKQNAGSVHTTRMGSNRTQIAIGFLPALDVSVRGLENGFTETASKSGKTLSSEAAASGPDDFLLESLHGTDADDPPACATNNDDVLTFVSYFFWNTPRDRGNVAHSVKSSKTKWCASGMVLRQNQP